MWLIVVFLLCVGAAVLAMRRARAPAQRMPDPEDPGSSETLSAHSDSWGSKRIQFRVSRRKLREISFVEAPDGGAW